MKHLSIRNQGDRTAPISFVLSEKISLKTLLTFFLLSLALGLQAQTIWTGATDTNWNIPGNWSPGVVPDATVDVIIPDVTNDPIITAGTAALSKTVEVQTGGHLTIAATASLTINGSKSVSGGITSPFYNNGTVDNNGRLILGNTGSIGEYGLWNAATFNNNSGGEITIDNTSGTALNNELGIFTNSAKITIGAIANAGDYGIFNYNSGTFRNNTGGDIKIDDLDDTGLVNDSGEFTNSAKITIGATACGGIYGLVNEDEFNNNTGGEIVIDNVCDVGLLNEINGVFTNAAKITIGAMVSGGIEGLVNADAFNNNAGGEIKINNIIDKGLYNIAGTFTNAAKITIDSGNFGLHNESIFNNNAGGEIKIDNAAFAGLVNEFDTFTNAAQITIGATTGSSIGLFNVDIFNNVGGEIKIDRSTVTHIFNGFGTFTNAATITLGAFASPSTAFANDDVFDNVSCGKLLVLNGVLENSTGSVITNAGLVQVTDNLTNDGTFTNDGVLKYGSLTGTVTSATNPSLIVNNTPTPIFTYGGTYNGTVNGIFTDAAATNSAGTFTAPNTFVPSAIPVGETVFYAKITPQGGACSFIVPFTYLHPAPTITTDPISKTLCTGSATTFTVVATNASSYQWQVNTGSGWNNIPVGVPYANATTSTLTVYNVANLNGNQYRCIATGNGSVNSNPATLTVENKPVLTLSVNGQNVAEGSTLTLCDNDANPVNSLQFIVSTNCVVGSPVWRVQVGGGAWSESGWSTTIPVFQPSNNQPHRYQAACNPACPSTFSEAISLTINYRASTPQNVSMIADGTTVLAGEEKSICDQVGNPLTFNGTCATGERLLYSVDGGVYLSTVPSQIVDGQFHNYRVRCQKLDGTPSCFETESGLIRLKISTIIAAPVASLNVTNGCGTPSSFSGTANCGGLTTVWYNATTNVALPNLPNTTPNETTSYYARCQGDAGCQSGVSNTVTFTVVAVNIAPTVSVSADLVCTGVSVTVSANCPAGSRAEWNTGVSGNSFSVSFNNVTTQGYSAKCVFENGCQSAVSDLKTVRWKAFELTIINIGQSKSAIKTNDRAAWASQFVTADGGPSLDNSTEINPTLYFTENANKTGPRYWTIHADACALGTGGSLTFDMLATPESGPVRSFNTHENNAPYFMYANRDGYTELYAQNHPAYGFYLDNGAGGNVYDAGLPKGLYKLGVRYWDQKGQGSIYPSTRQPQGTVLAYQEYWFRIQSKDGVGVGAARVSGLPFTVESLGFAEVAPNPVSSVLRLKVTDAKAQKVNISLIDASGRTLMQHGFTPETNTHQEEFNVSEIANGMYFLKVNAGEKQATLKVVKVQ